MLFIPGLIVLFLSLVTLAAIWLSMHAQRPAPARRDEPTQEAAPKAPAARKASTRASS